MQKNIHIDMQIDAHTYTHVTHTGKMQAYVHTHSYRHNTWIYRDAHTQKSRHACMSTSTAYLLEIPKQIH